MSSSINREKAIEAVANALWHYPNEQYKNFNNYEFAEALAKDALLVLPSAEATKKKAELKENGDWDCPDVDCDECDHHRGVEWCSLAIPKHEEIDETYKMINEAFFEGFEFAEKRYRLLIETVEELDEKLAKAEWIPCSERLPNEDARYLVQMSYGIIEVLSWANVLEKVDDFDFYNKKHGGWYDYDGEWGYYERNDVLAWMPLPTPYREDREEYELATEQMKYE